MNALVKTEIPALQMAEAELVSVMQNSIYPGAKLESIKLALGYCRAQGLDPMTKPVHIVPMSVKVKGDNGEKDRYVERDVVMPGIGLYRVQAARTGQYVGCSAPEFGPTKKLTFKEKRWEDTEGGRSQRAYEGEIEYPEWCRVTVRRLVGGQIAEFTAIEYWIENYATAGRDTTAPNAMWKKRPRGQLAKCAQAQALRMAFPELGAQATAEEMEGRSLDEDAAIVDGSALPASVAQPQVRDIREPKAAAPTTVEGEARREPDVPAAGGADDRPITEGALRILRAKLKQHALSDLDLCAAFKVDKAEALRMSQFEDVQAWITEH